MISTRWKPGYVDPDGRDMGEWIDDDGEEDDDFLAEDALAEARRQEKKMHPF